MPYKLFTLLTAALLSLPINVSALHAQEPGVAELKIVPADNLIMNPTNEGKRYYDTVIHSIVISPKAGQIITVQSMKISFLFHGHPILTKYIPIDRLVGESQGINEMVKMGLGALLNAQVLDDDGLAGLFGRPVSLAQTETINSSQALITTRHHFSLDFPADEALIEAEVQMPNGQSDVVSTRVKIETYNSPITYSSPVDGVWLATSGASIQGHHRLHPSSEFAIDFFKLDENGQINSGSTLLAENYFGFGAPVKAAAEGEVVFIINDVVQNRALMQPQAGESEEQTGQRLTMMNFENMASDFPRAIAGNIVVIKHEKNGHIEYSSYGHLATNSVKVSLGDLVKRGDVIGKTGDTGDSDTVHLHFQVNAGANPFTSKSLPMVFNTLKDVNAGADPLKFVEGNALKKPMSK